jgi:hypothetical protein
MAAIVALGLGLRHLVNVGPPLLMAAGLPGTLAVPVAVAPVWGVILAGIRVATGRASSEAGDEAEKRATKRNPRRRPAAARAVPRFLTVRVLGPAGDPI